MMQCSTKVQSSIFVPALLARCMLLGGHCTLPIHTRTVMTESGYGISILPRCPHGQALTPEVLVYVLNDSNLALVLAVVMLRFYLLRSNFSFWNANFGVSDRNRPVYPFSLLFEAKRSRSSGCLLPSYEISTAVASGTELDTLRTEHGL